MRVPAGGESTKTGRRDASRRGQRSLAAIYTRVYARIRAQFECCFTVYIEARGDESVTGVR